MNVFLTHDDITRDITSICGEFTIKGSIEQVARQLDMKVIRAGSDYYLPKVDIKTGDIITIVEDEEIIFTGIIWFRTLDDNDITHDITAYDSLIYLNKSDAETCVYNNETCDSIASKVCKELRLEVGELAVGEKITLNGRGSNAYELIMSAYTKAMRQNKKKYQMIAKGKKVTVIEKGKMLPIKLRYGTNNEEAQRIPGILLNVEVEETLDEMVNRVKVINQDQGDKKEAVISNDKDIKQYGLVQKVVNSTDENVKGLLQGSKIEMRAECFSNWDIMTGYMVEVISNTLNGKYYIESDDHKYYDGVHTVKLVLSTENRMDEVEEGGSKDEEGSNADFTGADSESLNKMISFALGKEGYKYSQAERMSPNAFDCSSLVLRSMRAAGLDTTGENLTSKSIGSDHRFNEIPKSSMKPGDVLWHKGHVAIYIGNGKTIEAMNPKKGVQKGNANRFTKAYRIKGA